MSQQVKCAFETQLAVLALADLTPARPNPAGIRGSAKFKQIAASIQTVGVIEPLVVVRSKDVPNKFTVLDGHLRLTALLDSGALEARCLIANEDEAFTYNKRINRLATIQEHLMIVKAIERGVSEDRLAQALNL